MAAYYVCFVLGFSTLGYGIGNAVAERLIRNVPAAAKDGTATGTSD